jgi:hypothetical protein
MKFRILSTIALLVVLAALLMISNSATSTQSPAPAGDDNGIHIN